MMKLSHKTTISFFLAGLFLSAVLILLSRVGLPLVWILFLGPLVAGLTGAAASKIFFKPIHRLDQAMEVVLSGNLDHPVVQNSNDEIGNLSRAFDRMIVEYKKTTESLYALNQMVAEYKKTELELKEREEYYRRLFEYSNDAVFIYDFDGRILDVNNKACKLLNYSKDNLMKIPFLDLQPEQELARSKAAFKTSTKSGSLRFESAFHKNDGSSVQVEISSSIVNLQNGIVQSIVSNITERKAIEKSLRESEEKFRTFMETSSDLMFITDAESCFTYVNEAMLRTLGYLPEEILGVPFAEILDKESLEYSKSQRQQLVDEGEDTHQLVWETKTRKKISGEMKATAIYDVEGRFQGIRGVFRDITERKKVEESQRLAQLGKLASDMAHEVNNQIGVISMRTAVSLMRGIKDEELKNDLKIISAQCDRIKNIVKRLLLFSKPSRGDFKDVNLNESIGLVVNLVEPQFSQHNVAILKEPDSSLPLVRADEKQLEEVFMNLLRNAFEAMPQGGTITVSSSRKGEWVRIEVSDTGSGISEEDLKHIFDPFFTTKENGTGLGLSVCYGIIQAHDGELKYSSKVGKGTMATVMLPVAES